MRPALLSRRVHKWLTLFVGVQLVLWTISGFYMVVVDLDFIHGDALVRNLRPPIATEGVRVRVNDILHKHPGVTSIALRALGSSQTPVYELRTSSGPVLIDARTGSQLSPLARSRIRDLAMTYYAGGGSIIAITLLESDPPQEIQTHKLPQWRVDFDDWLDTSFYLDPNTGKLMTRRHRFWRWFDFVWMLHIMDYDTRENINNPLLRVSTLLAVTTVGSGAWLLYFSFRRRRHVSGALQ